MHQLIVDRLHKYQPITHSLQSIEIYLPVWELVNNHQVRGGEHIHDLSKMIFMVGLSFFFRIGLKYTINFTRLM